MESDAGRKLARVPLYMTRAKWRPEEFHSWRPLLSRGALISIAEVDRDVGKSYPMIVRAFCRIQRNRRSMVWLRRTEEEIKEWLTTVGSAKWAKAIRQAGLDPAKVRRQGNKIMYDFGDERRHDWRKVIRAGAVSGWSEFRDTDDPAEELIYLDEAFATVEKYRRYQGNEVHDCLDIFKTLRREGSDIRLLIAGNAEKAVNPWFEYFGVSAPKMKRKIPLNSGPLYESQFCAIDPAKKGTGIGRIVYERGWKVAEDDLMTALSGTAYGDFLHGAPKGQNKALLRPVPVGARVYVSVDFGRPVSIWRAREGYFIVSMRRASGTVIRKTPNGSADVLLLCPELRKSLVSLRIAWARGQVFFDSAEAMEWGLPIIPAIT